MFDESDIDLLALTAAGFEEACFDLLLSMGFRNLLWRQGGADRGRDIEGLRFVDHPLVDHYQERWFFECKRYANGVSPETLNSKIAWADAEKPNHLVMLMTSHPTDAGLLWLEQIRAQKSYAIHVVDGKALRRLFTERPDLVAKYFVGPEQKLLLDARRNWLVHGIVPEAETLKLLADCLDFTKLDASQGAFLMSAARLRSDEVDALIDDSEPFYFDGLVPHLMDWANCESSVLPDEYQVIRCAAGLATWEVAFPRHVVAELAVGPEESRTLGLYCLVYDSDGEGVEMFVETSSDFAAKIRSFESDAGGLAIEAFRGLMLTPMEPPAMTFPGAVTTRMSVKVQRGESV